MEYKYFSKNGNVLPTNKATIPLENIAYQYGFGVYETLKVRNKVLYFAKQHVSRLIKSAKIIGLEHEYKDVKIIEYINDVVKKNKIDNCNIKMLLIGAKEAKDAELYIIPLAPLFPDKKLYTKGASVMTQVFERFLPNAKTLNMLPSYLFYTKASKLRHYDVLYIDNKGHILEGSRTNFFAIKGNVVTTPPKEKVLEGVTRQTVISVAIKNGFEVKEENILLKNISKYDGLFLTSTSSKIVPLRQIDTFTYEEIAPKLKDLMKAYDLFLDESNGIFTK